MPNNAHSIAASIPVMVAAEREVDVTIQIAQMIKGHISTASLQLRYPVGLEDTPRFSKHERVLLFLVPLESGYWQVVGGMQGKATLP